MDLTLALVFLAAGVGDMVTNHCQVDGCLARQDETVRYSMSTGAVLFQDSWDGGEIYLRRDAGHAFGPFQPILGVSTTDTGDLWVGSGFASTIEFGKRDQFYAQASTMAGLYLRNSGPDLGHILEFRSGLELGYEARSGIRFGLSFDHRSNASIADTNPGLETLAFRVSIPTN